LRTHAGLPEAAAAGVLRVQRDTLDRIPQILLKLGLYSEEALALHMAQLAGAERILDPIAVDTALVHEVTPEFLRAHEVLIVRRDDTHVDIVCWDATDDYPARAIEFATQRRARLLIGTRTQISAALHRVAPPEPHVAAESTIEPAFDGDEIDRLKDLASEEPVIRLVQKIVDEAVRQRASDIHIEPSDAALHVRYRRDGLLHEVHTQPKALSASITSRIKVMAGLNIAERRLPQDGRIRVTIQGKEIDFRVATSPTLHGESVVLRILDRQDVALDFSALGFDESITKVIRNSISRPYGIVLVTGPTGSGKTTTLYAALKEINTPDRKILTVEDPVEYILRGVNQVPIKPQIGLTFANALRAFLRQDPDIMMVGEIRDRETAEIAIQAALTGHLLLSTLHTNTAAAAVTRLLDMGIDDYLLTSTLHLILGQRLLRKLCEYCRRPHHPSDEVRDRFGVSGGTPPTWFMAVGCAQCQGGYRGRTTIVEALVMTDAVRSKVLARADAHEIERTAVDDGMRTLVQHGLHRVGTGVTTIEEVLRVTNPG
jgi:general secretion pathway protein E